MSTNKSESTGSAIKNRIAAYENLAKNNKSKTGKLLRVEPPKPGYSGTKAHRDSSNVRGREKYNIAGPIKTKPQPEKNSSQFSPSKQQPVNHRSEQRDDSTKHNHGLVDTMLTIGRDDNDQEIPEERSISPLSSVDFGPEVRRDDHDERRNLALNALQPGGGSNPKKEVIYSLFSPEITNTNQPVKKKTDNDFSLFKVSEKNEVKKEGIKKEDIKREDIMNVDINNQFSESKSKTSDNDANRKGTNKNIDKGKQPNPEYKQKRNFFGRNHEKNVEVPSQQKSEVTKQEQRAQEIGSDNKPVFTQKSVENPMECSIPSVDLPTFNDIDHLLQPSKDDNYALIPRVQGSTIEAMNQSQTVEYYYNDSFSSSTSSDSISKLTKSTVSEVDDEQVNALIRSISDEYSSQHNDDDDDCSQNIDYDHDCDDVGEVSDDRIQDVRVDDTLADEINNYNVHVENVEGNSFDEVDKDEVVQNQVLYTNDTEDEDVKYEDIENNDACSVNEDVKYDAKCDVDVEYEVAKDQQSNEDGVESEQDLEEEDDDHDDEHDNDHDDDGSTEDQYNRNGEEAAITSTNQGDNKDHDIVQKLATSSLDSETTPIGVSINMSLSSDSEPDMVGRYNVPSGSMKEEQLSHGVQLSRSSNMRQSRDSSFMSQHRYDSHSDKYNLNLLKSRTNEFDMFTPQNNTSNNNYRIFGENELVVDDTAVSVLTEDSFGEGLKQYRNSNNQSLDKISYRNDESVIYTDQSSNSTKNATSRSTRVFRDASPLRSDNIMVRRNSSGLSEISGETSSLKKSSIPVKRVITSSMPNNKPNLPTISNYDGKIKKKRSFLRSLSPFRRQPSDAESDNTKAFDNRNRRDKNDNSKSSQPSLEPRGRSKSVGSRQSLGSGNGEDEDSRSPFLGIEISNTPAVLERPNMVKTRSSGRFFGLFRKR